MLKSSFVKVIVGVLFLLLSVSMIAVPSLSFPGDKPAIIVEPTSIKDPSITPGSTFTINVKLYNVTTTNVPEGIVGVEIKLVWDAAVLNLVSKTHGLGKLGGVLNPPVLIAKDEAGSNYYWLAGASTGNPWWGDGIIATITFKVLAVGKTNLDLSFTELMDVNIISIPHYVQSGLFDNRPILPPAKVYLDPAKVINSSLTSCSNFNISIKVEDVNYLSQFKFNLSFNPEVLEVKNASWAPGITGPLSLNNTKGFISGTGSISPSITGSATIVTITFHVKALGESYLPLTNLSLKDHWGDDLLFTSTDGYFNNQLITKIYVDPSYLMDPTLRPGDIVPVPFNIMGENFNNIAHCEFNFTFNPAVIKVLEYMVNPFNSSIAESQVTLSNRLGTLSAKINYEPPLSFTREKLMTLTFQIVGYGISYLNLSSSLILDVLGEQVTHQVEHGLLITVIRDVAIIDIQPTPTQVYPGRIVTISVVAKNLGNLSESFSVSLYVSEDILIGTMLVDGLAPGKNITLVFKWNTTGMVPCNWHTLWANASTVPYEINILNNVLIGPVQVKIKIFGDIDGDGVVGLTDLVLLARSYRSKEGDLSYNSDADMDGNGVINLVDLVTLATRYNRTC